MRLRAILIGLLAVGLALPEASAVVLRYKFTEGEVFWYRDHFAMAFEGNASVGERRRLQIRAESRVKETVKTVDGEEHQIEVETIENDTTRTDETGAEETFENLGSPELITLTGRGAITERRELKEDEEAGPSSGLVTPLDEFAIVQQVFDQLTLAEGEVEPGAEWATEMKVDLTADLPDRTWVELKPTTKFERIVTVQGERCAELVTTFEIELRAPNNKETRELNVSINGRILGHLTSYFGIDRGRAIVELATIGVHGTFTLAPKDIPDKLTVSGRLKANIKTVLEED